MKYWSISVLCRSEIPGTYLIQKAAYRPLFLLLRKKKAGGLQLTRDKREHLTPSRYLLPLLDDFSDAQKEAASWVNMFLSLTTTG
jgi:hypothetical protein